MPCLCARACIHRAEWWSLKSEIKEKSKNTPSCQAHLPISQEIKLLQLQTTWKCPHHLLVRCVWGRRKKVNTGRIAYFSERNIAMQFNMEQRQNWHLLITVAIICMWAIHQAKPCQENALWGNILKIRYSFTLYKEDMLPSDNWTEQGS